MMKHRWAASLRAVLTSKRVVVASVAAVALVLGVMSAGAAVLMQKKISDIADVQGAPYTPAQHPGRYTVERGATSAVASASTDTPSSSRQTPKQSIDTPAQSQSTPAVASAVPPGPLPPGNAGAAAQAGTLPPVASPAPPPHIQLPPATKPSPAQPAPSLLDPLASLLSLQVQTPLLSIGVGL